MGTYTRNSIINFLFSIKISRFYYVNLNSDNKQIFLYLSKWMLFPNHLYPYKALLCFLSHKGSRVYKTPPVFADYMITFFSRKLLVSDKNKGQNL